MSQPVLVATVVDVPPDPLALAQKLSERSGWSLLLGRDRSYLAVDPVATSLDLDPDPGLEVVAAARDLASAPRWIGLLPYEARRDLERTKGEDRR